MAEIFFRFDQSGLDTEQLQQWSRMVGELHRATALEFYQANIEVEIPPGSDMITLARASLGAIRIIRFHSPGISRTSRTAAQIKNDRADAYVIWFITNGTVRVAQNGATAVAGPGEFVIMEAGRPFRLMTSPGETGYHESHQVLVPKHFSANIIPEISQYICKGLVSSGPALIAYQIFSALFEDGDSLPLEQANALAEQALKSLAIYLAKKEPSNKEDGYSPVRRRVENYIRSHFSDPGITAGKVARACNVSLRLLHELFRGEESFHKNIVKRRLLLAQSILEDPGSENLNISQVAYMCGFVSHAHFSRVFKENNGCTPREFKKRRTS